MWAHVDATVHNLETNHLRHKLGHLKTTLALSQNPTLVKGGAWGHYAPLEACDDAFALLSSRALQKDLLF